LKKLIQTPLDLKPDSSIIIDDVRRLKTLPSILNASADIFITDTGSILEYRIEERWTLLPVGDFGVSDDGAWIGAGAMESNAFGRGIYLYGYLQYRTPFIFHAIFRNPYLFGSKWGFEFQSRIFEIEENPQFVDFDTYLLSEHRILGKYELEFEKDFLIGLAHSKEKIISNEQIIDDKMSLRFIVESRFQRLNYNCFVIDGWQNNFLFSYRNVLTDQENSISFYDELKYYWSPGILNLAARLAYGYSTEQEYFYLPFIIDNYNNVRGSGYRVFRGNRLTMLNLEGRFTVFENNFSGIQTILFTDIGKVSQNFNSKISRASDKLYYAGPGIRFIYKKAYNAVLSIDYGFNIQDYKQGGWVLGWGQYF
jgi:hypothetical protein